MLPICFITHYQTIILFRYRPFSSTDFQKSLYVTYLLHNTLLDNNIIQISSSCSSKAFQKSLYVTYLLHKKLDENNIIQISSTCSSKAFWKSLYVTYLLHNTLDENNIIQISSTCSSTAFWILLYVRSNEVIVYRVMMYANPLLIVQAMNYTESVVHIFFIIS